MPPPVSGLDLSGSVKSQQGNVDLLPLPEKQEPPLPLPILGKPDHPFRVSGCSLSGSKQTRSPASPGKVHLTRTRVLRRCSANETMFRNRETSKVRSLIIIPGGSYS